MNPDDPKAVVQPQKDLTNGGLFSSAFLGGAGVLQFLESMDIPKPWIAAGLAIALILRFGPEYLLRFKRSWQTNEPWTPPYGSLVLLLAAGLVAGCATSARTEFIDADGTSFTAISKAGAFGKLDTTNQQMAYDWDESTGGISVGQDAQGLDNSGQIAALQSLGSIIGDVVAGLVSSGALTPSLPSGGDSGPLTELLEKREQLCTLLRIAGLEVPAGLCP